jgi:hypothetical protein
MSFVPLPRLVFPTSAPFFCGDEHAVNEAFIPPHLLPVIELVEEGPPHVEQGFTLGPLLQAAVDGAPRTVPLGQFAPRRTRPQNPEDALEALAVVRRGATAFLASRALGQLLADERPLLICYCSPSHRLGKLSEQNYLSTSFGMTSRHLTPGITRRPARQRLIKSFVSAVGCMPLLDGPWMQATSQTLSRESVYHDAHLTPL